MNIEDLKERKVELEKSILNLIALFEAATKTTVTEIMVDKVSASNKCGSDYITNIDVKIEI